MAVFAILLGATALQAQTPEEIIERMSEQLDRCEKEGYEMDMVLKIPIIGEFRTHNMILGDKLRMEMVKGDKKSMAWSDKDTQWDYDPEKKEITITKREAKKTTTEEKSDLSTFDSITEGYDVSLKKEDADAWYIVCKKSKSNKDKDDPKQMDIAVSKSTYLPVYLKTKQSGITVSLENFVLGVSDESVTFNPADFPNTTIIDKR